jgi:hypothetical protein
MDENIEMEDDIPLIDQSSIVDAIWGPALTDTESQEREAALKWYLRYCDGEKTFALRRNQEVLHDTPLNDMILRLKENSQKPKRSIASAVEDGNATTVVVDDAGNPATSTAEDDGKAAAPAEAFELLVRIVFLTACVSASRETFGGDFFSPRWNESESLVAYINRVYPRDRPAPQDVKPIRIDKLAVGYLTSYAKVDLIWTHRLTDHLILLKRSNRKTLSIFRHPAFLKVSLETLEDNNDALEQSTADALSL